MKARNVKLKVVEAADASTLEESVTAWLKAAGAADLQNIDFRADGTSLYAFITYTE